MMYPHIIFDRFEEGFEGQVVPDIEHPRVHGVEVESG